MEQKPKYQFKIPSEGLLNPEQLRARQIAEIEEKRFQEIADEIISVLIKHSVQYREINRVIETFIGKIEKPIKDATIDKVLKL